MYKGEGAPCIQTPSGNVNKLRNWIFSNIFPSKLNFNDASNQF